MKEKILSLIDLYLKRADVYEYNGSIWIIFSSDSRWVIEYCKDGILWYNYNIFQIIFDFFNMNAHENKHYITEWFSKRFLTTIIDDDILKLKSKYPEMVNKVINNGEVISILPDFNNTKCKDIDFNTNIGVEIEKQYTDDSIFYVTTFRSKSSIETIVDDGSPIYKKIIETHQDYYHHNARINGVIKNGDKKI